MNLTILQLVALIASAVIFWRTEPVLNLMGPQCRTPIRVAFWLLAVSSAALIITITQGYRPSGAVVLALMGVAILLASERRVKGLLRIHTPVSADRRAS
jgi:hypothetical protein